MILLDLCNDVERVQVDIFLMSPVDDGGTQAFAWSENG